jgi:Fe-S-cluster containining protein
VFSERYREIVAEVDAEFRRNRTLHGNRIQCRSGCSECCHQLFRITEIDADHIANALAAMASADREALRDRARTYLDALQQLPPESPRRLGCPALVDGVCTIYESRPLICRKFGMPLYNPEKPDRIFACELNFRSGEEIHDPDLIQIQTRIHNNWKQLQADYLTSRGASEAGRLNVAAAILMSPR